MKVLKFKAWHIDSKVMFDVLAIAFQNKQIVVKWHGAERAINADQFYLLQFSGLKDRKGIEIYEGDILKCDFSRDNNGTHDSIQVVEFYEGSFGSRNKGDHFRIPALFSGRATQGMNLNYYEVIGNIYQNPGLITNP